MPGLKTLALVAALLTTAAPAAAATYVGSHTVGTSGLVNVSITTDDTLGVLGSGNILDWTIHVQNSTESQDLFGPLSGANSVLRLGGTALSATSTELLFDYDGQGVLAFVTEFSSAVRGLCLDGAVPFTARCLGAPTGSELLVFGIPNPDNLKVLFSGTRQLGMATAGAAPEPGAWALMIAGFGLAGGALRRRGLRRVAG